MHKQELIHIAGFYERDLDDAFNVMQFKQEVIAQLKTRFATLLDPPFELMDEGEGDGFGIHMRGHRIGKLYIAGEVEWQADITFEADYDYLYWDSMNGDEAPFEDVARIARTFKTDPHVLEMYTEEFGTMLVFFEDSELVEAAMYCAYASAQEDLLEDEGNDDNA